MKVLVNLHTEDLLSQAYIWVCKLITFKKALSNTFQRAHNMDVDLTIASKWGFDLYHFSIYFDSEIEYDKNLFRSVKYIRLGEQNDTYYIISDVYNKDDIKKVIQSMYFGSGNTNFK